MYDLLWARYISCNDFHFVHLCQQFMLFIEPHTRDASLKKPPSLHHRCKSKGYVNIVAGANSIVRTHSVYSIKHQPNHLMQRIQCSRGYKTNPFEALTHTTTLPPPQMDPLPSWIQRPFCKCGHRAKIGTSTKRATLGRRFYECPDLDDDFMVIIYFQIVIYSSIMFSLYYPRSS